MVHHRDISPEATSSGVVLRTPRETLRVDAWGPDTFRVRARPRGAIAANDIALARLDPADCDVVVRDDGSARLSNGLLHAQVESTQRIAFLSAATGEELLAEPWVDEHELPWIPNRRYRDAGPDSWEIEAVFSSYAGERIYGLGQRSLGRLDFKGCSIDLLQRNSEVAIPVVVSSRNYGMFWNCPSTGRVEFAQNLTRWRADRAHQLDYFIYAGDSPAGVVRRYHDITGLSPELPAWATGFWQSNNYYTSQAELTAVAREYRARGLPLAAMLVDFMHWTHMGNWDWDHEAWPDPSAMVRELADHGTRVVVSVWPHVSPHSRHYGELRSRGLLVAAEPAPDGEAAVFSFADRAFPEGLDLALLDLTHPGARQFLRERLEESYHSLGIDTFWLDACEPELSGDGQHLREAPARFAAGDGEAVASLYPLHFSAAVREGLRALGSRDGVLLARSAWAGSQRYGVAVWSGDIPSTWETLRQQIAAGQSMMVSGIDWWTSDVGGFFLSDPQDEDFRELLIRWFQFGAFWPVLRLHGNRDPDFYNGGIFLAGGPNEIWSFGPTVERVLTGWIWVRERLRPYLQEQLRLASRHATPPVRPMWFEFPEDERVIGIDDQFMLGSAVLVAPVHTAGARSRIVYLPSGRRWTEAWSGVVHEGGQAIEAAAPIERIPVFESDGGPGIGPDWMSQP